MTNLVPGTIACRSAFIRYRSTMDISSMIITSVSNGLPALRSNMDAFPFFMSRSLSASPLISNIRWIVIASYPVASVIRFAALPVGAAKRISNPSCSKYWIIPLIVVVLPVPGPPVKTTILSCATAWIASFCFSANVICSVSSIIAIIVSTSEMETS